jgi:hypothetical protein
VNFLLNVAGYHIANQPGEKNRPHLPPAPSEENADETVCHEELRLLVDGNFTVPSTVLSAHHVVRRVCLRPEKGSIARNFSVCRSCLINGQECGVMWQIPSWMLSLINRARVSVISSRFTVGELHRRFRPTETMHSLSPNQSPQYSFGFFLLVKQLVLQLTLALFT